MRPYLSHFAARFRTQLQYRAAAWAGIGTQIFFGVVRVMIFDGFYSSSTAVQPLSHAQIMSYIWLGQALIMVVPFRMDSELANMIRTGNVAYEMARPVSVTWVWLFRALADRIAPALLRSIPQLLFSIFLLRWVGWGHLGLGPPASTAAGFLSLLSVGAGTAVSATLSVIAMSTLFWTISGNGVSTVFGIAIWLFSGIVIPLPLLPQWAQPVMRLLPFRAMIDVPFRIYIGDIGGIAAVTEIFGQLAWAAALSLLAWILVTRGIRRLVVQGG